MKPKKRKSISKRILRSFPTIKDLEVKPDDDTIFFIKDNKIKVSVIAPSIRSKYWTEIYNSLFPTYVDFEFIFCGPVKPTPPLPPNFIYIYSEVKPSQCLEICRRRVTGDFIMHGADDIFFHAYFLDHMVATFLEAKSEKAIVSARMTKTVLAHEKVRPNTRVKDMAREIEWGYTFWGTPYPDDNIKIKDIPSMAFCTFITRKLFEEIEGVDRNFISIQMNMDIVMRILAIGGKVVHSKKSWAIEKRVKPRLSQDMEYGILQGNEILRSMWCKEYDGGEIDTTKFYSGAMNNKVISRTRLIPFEPFENKDLLTVSQGEKGRWV